MSLQLVIGNKNYSSWSLRPWLLLDHFQIAFREIPIRLFTPGYEELLKRYSPNLKVPVLIDEELTVWESLAICEYVNEQYLHGKAMPAGREARAMCRSFCHEMHVGFPAIRIQLPMNCRALRTVQISPQVASECQRVNGLWTQARRRFVDQGEYLFGRFSLADCMFAPMVLRFHTYGLELGPEAAAYRDFLLDNPSLQRWWAAARREPDVLAAFEVGSARSV